MAKINYRYLRVKNGLPAVAIVELEINKNNSKEINIHSAVEKIPFQSQGMIEGGHDIWVESAVCAIEAFFNSFETEEGFEVVVKKLKGRILLDTNNASIGVACILCLMQYFELEVGKVKYSEFHEFVGENWKADFDEIPDFRVLFKN